MKSNRGKLAVRKQSIRKLTTSELSAAVGGSTVCTQTLTQTQPRTKTQPTRIASNHP